MEQAVLCHQHVLQPRENAGRWKKISRTCGKTSARPQKGLRRSSMQPCTWGKHWRLRVLKALWGRCPLARHGPPTEPGLPSVNCSMGSRDHLMHLRIDLHQTWCPGMTRGAQSGRNMPGVLWRCNHAISVGMWLKDVFSCIIPNLEILNCLI